MREQVVYNMVWVVHDALEKCVINGFCQFCERGCFWGNIGHYGCHGVRELASVGCQLQRKNPTRHLLHRGVCQA